MSSEKEPTKSVDDLIKERFDTANDKAEEMTKLIKRNLEDGGDELSIFLEVARAVETAALIGPSMLNALCAEFAALAIKLAKAQMEK